MAPPPGTKRMTANPKRPARYRPGKAIAESESSEEEDDSAGEAQVDEDDSSRAAPPKATSFPADGTKRIAQKQKQDFKHVDLDARRKAAELQERMRVERERRRREADERDAGFVTESEDDSDNGKPPHLDLSDDEQKIDDIHRMGGESNKSTRPAIRQQDDSSSDSSGSESDDSSDSADSASSSSSSDHKPKPLRPVFIPKSQRNTTTATTTTTDPPTSSKPPTQSRTDAFVQAALDRAAAERAAAQKAWDDDEPDAETDPTAQVDDTDGVNPALEKAQWEARELSRMKRARAVIEEREAALAESERRRALAPAERAAEDAAHLAAQAEQQEGKGQAGYMARYHHRGAFFRDDAERAGLLDRDLMGARFEDESRAGKSALPAYLQVRDATKIGKKGRTRYRDLRAEDTGRWGEFGSRRDRGMGMGMDVQDDRFRPDADGRGDGPTGANASAVLGRKRAAGEEESDGKRVKRDQVVS